MKKINTGGSAYIEGNVNTKGGKFVGRDDNSVNITNSSVNQAFSNLYERIDSDQEASTQDKLDIKSELGEIKSEILKGQKANEGFIQRRLRNIGRMSTDILDVILASMLNPALGFGLVARKVAEKIKVESMK